MKKAVLLSILMVSSILVIAQVPESFNYQVVVRDGTSNNPLVNQDVSFKMSILKGSSSGESQYSEFHSANTGDLGIVNLVIGNGTGKTGDITTIDWGADTYYLKVEIDKTGGSAYVEMGTTQLLSVPYALHSKDAETAADAVKITGDQMIEGNKTFMGTTTVKTPVNPNDAVTKEYTDNASPCSDLYSLIDSLYHQLDTAIKESVVSPIMPPVSIVCNSYLLVDKYPVLEWIVTDPVWPPEPPRDVVYDVYLSGPFGLTLTYSNLLNPGLQITQNLECGEWFWRVIIKDFFNHIQVSPLQSFAIPLPLP